MHSPVALHWNKSHCGVTDFTHFDQSKQTTHFGLCDQGHLRPVLQGCAASYYIHRSVLPSRFQVAEQLPLLRMANMQQTYICAALLSFCGSAMAVASSGADAPAAAAPLDPQSEFEIDRASSKRDALTRLMGEQDSDWRHSRSPILTR
jgi:hypothetical protein